MTMKNVEGNENEYIRILLKRNTELQLRLEKATKIYWKMDKELKDLKVEIDELREFIITLY